MPELGGTGPISCSALSPDTAPPGTNIAVSFCGNDFQRNVQIKVDGVLNGPSTFKVTSIVWVTNNQIDAVFQISAAAEHRAYEVRVVNPPRSISIPGQESKRVYFVVSDPANPTPELFYLDPKPLLFLGQTQRFTLRGAHFDGTATIEAENTGVHIDNLVVSNADTLSADFIIDPMASTGIYDVRVRTSAGLSQAVACTNAPLPDPPIISVIAPNFIVAGAPTNVFRIYGSQFNEANAETTDPSTLTMESRRASGATPGGADVLEVNVSFATVGEHQVYVRSIGGTSQPGTIYVLPAGTPVPSITSLSFANTFPDGEIYTGTSRYVELLGENFGNDPAATVWLLGPGGITAESIPPTRNPGQLNTRRIARITVDEDAPEGISVPLLQTLWNSLPLISAENNSVEFRVTRRPEPLLGGRDLFLTTIVPGSVSLGTGLEEGTAPRMTMLGGNFVGDNGQLTRDQVEFSVPGISAEVGQRFALQSDRLERDLVVEWTTPLTGDTATNIRVKDGGKTSNWIGIDIYDPNLPLSAQPIAFKRSSPHRKGAGDRLVSGHYRFRTTLSPVFLNGRYPFAVAGISGGSVRVTTDSHGHVSGIIEALGQQTPIAGRVQTRDHAVRLTLRGSAGSHQMTASSVLQGAQFVGTARTDLGRESVALDVSSAARLSAICELDLVVSASGRIHGRGFATIGKESIPIVARGATTASGTSIRVIGRHFSWRARGTAAESLMRWSANGFGSAVSGKNAGILRD